MNILKLKSGYYFVFLIINILLANFLLIGMKNDVIQQEINQYSITSSVYSFIKIVVILTQLSFTIMSTVVLAYISSLFAFYKFDLNIKVSLFFKIGAIVQSIQLLEALILNLSKGIYEDNLIFIVFIISLQLSTLYILTKKLIGHQKLTYSLVFLYTLFFSLGKLVKYIS
ncbi:hypothetical protein AB3N02_30685 [Priestia aryabhattai]|jgi:hypothetical protein|uniref:hypothetical protein n=1 Tax=Priestia aryabhattai TaxID=412384 RepID=UPI0039A0C699